MVWSKELHNKIVNFNLKLIKSFWYLQFNFVVMMSRVKYYIVNDSGIALGTAKFIYFFLLSGGRRKGKLIAKPTAKFP